MLFNLGSFYAKNTQKQQQKSHQKKQKQKNGESKKQMKFGIQVIISKLYSIQEEYFQSLHCQK
jgi:accessory gene regulator protein AgrB